MKSLLSFPHIKTIVAFAILGLFPLISVIQTAIATGDFLSDDLLIMAAVVALLYFDGVFSGFFNSSTKKK